jgi:putative tryptophan/tyrosine transport system substrate-binding protein
MKRRAFISLLGGAATAWPLAARAQQTDRIKRICVLWPYTKDDPENQRRREVFEQSLQRLGWLEGRNITIEYRWFGGEPALARVEAKDLVALQPDVIVAGTTPGLAAAAQETRTIPIVFVAVSDPVDQGFVASLARPGGNATGFTFFEFSTVGKGLEALKQIAPGVSRVGLPFNPDTRSNISFLPVIETVAPSLALEFIKAPVRNAGDIETAIAEIARKPGSGLMLLPDPFTIFHREQIVDLAARHHLPAAYVVRSFVTAGGLMSYGVDVTDLYRRAADYVDRILKGAKTADLPVQQPNKFELVINLKTAKALGLEIPATLLARADEVIE